MFTFYHSNHLDLLQSLLASLMAREPLPPMAPEHVLVQSSGMSQWLSYALCDSLGVSAHIQFPLPAAFIWQLFTQLIDDIPEQSAFNKITMTWRLMQLFPECIDLPHFEPLRDYLLPDPINGSPAELDPWKAYQFAEQLADVYDGYLVYRPDWISQWERTGQVAELADAPQWQGLLWQKLYQQTLADGQAKAHRANLYQDCLQALQRADASIKAHLPPRLFIFGISSFPPGYIQILQALGQHTDVHLFILNPCRMYWGDIRDQKYLAKLHAKSRRLWQTPLSQSPHQPAPQLIQTLSPRPEFSPPDALFTGNSLLASWGKQGRDHLYLLSQTDAQEIEAFVEAERHSLLKQIQADILTLSEPNLSPLADRQQQLLIDADDRSLSFHVCHSQVREVEALHDHLLDLFAQDRQLSPKDVIVMVADIAAYSPAIEAIFGHAPKDRFIPYALSDRNLTQEHPLFAALLKLLALPESRAQSQDILSLLEVPAVMRRFDINQAECIQLYDWVDRLAIRWGWDNHTATHWGMPGQYQNTWLFGLQRLLMGYAVAGFDSPLTANLLSAAAPDAMATAEHMGTQEHFIAPFDDIEGMKAALAGKLIHFIDTLAHYAKQLAQPMSLMQWLTHINQLMDDCFAVEEAEQSHLTRIRQTLLSWQQQLEQANFRGDIHPEIVRHYFDNHLSQTKLSQRFLIGHVNFCTLMPMRSIPFKVICLLGMNDGVYPRHVPPNGLDLMHNRSRIGDRSRREDDRYLFLEALLCAQEKLYISYVGRSIVDNSVKNPSILVTELRQYCQHHYQLSATGTDGQPGDLLAAITREYAMTPYHPSCFQTPHPSYAQEWLKVAQHLQQATTPTAQAAPLDLGPWQSEGLSPVLPLAELHKFWRLPAAAFFQRRLQVYFQSLHQHLENEEPFHLDRLMQYQLRQEWIERGLKHALADSDTPAPTYQQWIAEKRAMGVLPLAEFGALALTEIEAEATTLLQALTHRCRAKYDDLEVDLCIEVNGRPWQLHGWLGHHYLCHHDDDHNDDDHNDSGQKHAGLVYYRHGALRGQDWLAAWLNHLCWSAITPASADSGGSYLIGCHHQKVEQYYWPLCPQTEAISALQDFIALFEQGLQQPLPYLPSVVFATLKASTNKQGQWDDAQSQLPATEQKMAQAFCDPFLPQTSIGQNPYVARLWPQWDLQLAQASRTYAQTLLYPIVQQAQVLKETR